MDAQKVHFPGRKTTLFRGNLHFGGGIRLIRTIRIRMIRLIRTIRIRTTRTNRTIRIEKARMLGTGGLPGARWVVAVRPISKKPP